MPNPELYFLPFQGGGGTYVSFERYEQNPVLKEILASNTSSAAQLELVSRSQPNVGAWNLLKIHRAGGDLMDQVLFEWKSAAKGDLDRLGGPLADE